MKRICWFQVIPLELCLIFFHSGITSTLNFEPEKFAVISIPSRDFKQECHIGIKKEDLKHVGLGIKK